MKTIIAGGSRGPIGATGATGATPSADTLTLNSINSPTYTKLQQIIDVMLSPGVIDGGVASNNGDGTVDISAGNCLIKSTDSDTGLLYSAKWDLQSSVSMTDNALSYFVATFVDISSDPTIASTTTKPTNRNQGLIVGAGSRSGNELHLTNEYNDNVANGISKLIERHQDTDPFEHVDGAVLTETGTRNIKVTAGNWWVGGLNKVGTIEQDTSNGMDSFENFITADSGVTYTTNEATIAAAVFTGAGLDDMTSSGTFVGSHTQEIHVEIDGTGTPDTYKWSYFGNDGVTVIEQTGVSIVAGPVNLVDDINITFAATTGHTLGDEWDFTAYLTRAINNTQYNDITSGLSTLTNNKYGLHWVWTDTHGHIAVIFGEGDYTLSEAEDQGPPSTFPVELGLHGRLIGRIIIKKNATSAVFVENNYDNAFSSAVPLDLSDYFLQAPDLTTLDAPYIDFQASADADATSAISTLTTSGSTTHHIQVDINGTKAWIAVSTNNPS